MTEPTSPDPVLASLLAAVERVPDDLPLRLHLARKLIGAGRELEAVVHCAVALQHNPEDAAARALMVAVLGEHAPSTASLEPAVPARAEARDHPADSPASEDAARDPAEFWRQAEGQFDGLVPPMFVDEAASSEVAAWDVERPSITLADVGGLEHVKARLEAAFLAPLRNPELQKLYGKSLRGGLLLYGPPGCGKTFLARAVAGELGAKFIPVGIADILDMYVGNSEGNLHEIFQLARQSAPCVLFLDELDALGQKRSLTRNSALRTTVNQLLTELDGAVDSNDGVFVLGATNQPWDIDPALRRPGRLDRTLLVLPPDDEARKAIFANNLKSRPIGGVDLARCAAAADGFSGADIAHVCESAAELALLDSVRTGHARLITQTDLDTALSQITPSITPWLQSARTVVQYGTDDGTFKDLRNYLKKRRLV
ncbi:MAG: AAA family ATPase [Actinobacteria bacterium]|nr:AAA family ATPase [Actinomycetota bacterium]